MKSGYKVGLSALTIVIIIIGSFLYSTNALRNEVVKNHLKDVGLHVSVFSDHIEQTFTNINLSMTDLSILINNTNALNAKMKALRNKNPYIRSIDILNANNIIIHSTNSINLNKHLKIDDYYPKPLFDNGILRFGKAKNARDLFTDDKLLSFMPILKNVQNNGNNYNIVITINNEYIINRYINNIHKKIDTLEIIRLDGKLLLSTIDAFMAGTNIQKSVLFNDSIEKTFSSGIETVNAVKNVSAYYLTNTFPLAISIKRNYKKSMHEWENKNLKLLLFISLITLLIASIIVTLIMKYIRAKNKEIEYHEKLLLNQDKLKNAYIVFDKTNDGIIITDENANIIDANNSYLINSGYSHVDIYGKNPRILKSNEHDDNFYKAIWEQLNENNYWHGEIINKNKDGKLFPELLTINKVFDENNEVKNYIGIFTDISKQREQEKELKEKEKFIFQQSKMASMGEMLENIAHQWRQPLSIISTSATGLLFRKEFGKINNEEEIKLLNLIEDSSQHLSSTIDDFRNFFKPDMGKEDFSLSHVIEQSLQIVSSKFKNRNIQIIKNIIDIQMNGYNRELMQVIINILNNSRDILEQHKTDDKLIFIETKLSKNNAVTKIKDTGGGFDESIKDKLFEPYFTTKHQSNGTGIGLYMSEEIITKHMNGTLEAINTRFEYNHVQHSGAQFIINIPLS